MGVQKNLKKHLKLASVIQETEAMGIWVLCLLLQLRSYKPKRNVTNRHLSFFYTSVFLCKKVDNSLLFLETTLSFLLEKQVLLRLHRMT